MKHDVLSGTYDLGSDLINEKAANTDPGDTLEF